MAEKEYIEREAVKNVIKRLLVEPPYQHNGEDYYTGVTAVEMELCEISTADVVKVRHGEWVEFDNYICNSDDKPVAKIGTAFICSECGRKEYKKEPYCHCGAKMDGKGENNG